MSYWMRFTLFAVFLCWCVAAMGQEDGDVNEGGLDDMEESRLPNPAPLETPPAPSLLSDRFPKDHFELCEACLYVEQWDRPDTAVEELPPTVAPIDWPTRTNYHRLHAPTRWKLKTDNVPFPDQWYQVDFNKQVTFAGGALQVLMWDKTYGTAASTWRPSVQYEHLFYRYYVYFDPEVSNATKCDGGKLPGMANPYPNGNSGDGRLVNGGHMGWSLRGGYGINCPGEPNHPLVNVTTYAYHADMRGEYGDHWRWGSVKTGEWHCLEGEVKVNTPGIRDGVLRGWINEELKFEKLDLFLRAPPYDSRLVGEGLIKQFWGTLHHGGKYGMFYGRPGARAGIRIDQVVVATERVGCYATEPPPTPCELCQQNCQDTACTEPAPTGALRKLQ